MPRARTNKKTQERTQKNKPRPMKKQKNLELFGILEKWKIEQWKNGTCWNFGKMET